MCGGWWNWCSWAWPVWLVEELIVLLVMVQRHRLVWLELVLLQLLLLLLCDDLMLLEVPGPLLVQLELQRSRRRRGANQ